MKTLRLNQIVAPIIVATALFGTLAHGYAAAPAPTDSYTNTFDTSTQPSWIYWYGLGYGNTPITWDGTMDAQSNVNSGSLLIQLPLEQVAIRRFGLGLSAITAFTTAVPFTMALFSPTSNSISLLIPAHPLTERVISVQCTSLWCVLAHPAAAGHSTQMIFSRFQSVPAISGLI